MAPKADDNKDYVAVMKDENMVFFIKWGKDANFFSLEDKDEDLVVIFKDSINSIPREIQKLKEILNKQKKV